MEMHKFIPKLISFPDHQILIPTLQALSALTRKFTEVHYHTLSFVTKLFPFLESEHIQVSVNAIQTISNILGGSDTNTQTLINLGIIDKLIKCGKNRNCQMRKEYGLCIGNILCGLNDQIAAVMLNPQISFNQMLLDNDPRVVHEGLYCIHQVISAKHPSFTLALIQRGTIANLLAIMKDIEKLLLPKLIIVLDILISDANKIMSRDQWLDLINKIKNDKNIE